MSKSDPRFDYHHYRKLLAEATDEPKRLALIDLLIQEGARDKLAQEVTRENAFNSQAERVLRLEAEVISRLVGLKAKGK
jgi:hypothetical protein